MKELICSSPEMKALAKDNLDLIKNGEAEQEQIEELFSSCDTKSPVLIQILWDEARVLGAYDDINEIYKEIGRQKCCFDTGILVDEAFSDFEESYIELLSDFEEYDKEEWDSEDDYLEAKEEADEETIEREQNGFVLDFNDTLDESCLLTPDNFDYMLGELAIPIGDTGKYNLNLWTDGYLEMYDDYLKGEIGYLTDALDCIVYVDYEF